MVDNLDINNLRILVIDDDELDRMLAVRSLKSQNPNFSIDEAGDIMTANGMMKNNFYDCIIVDYLFPGHTGLDVIRDFVSPDKPPFTGFVMLTGEGDESLVVQALSAGVHDYLVKDKLTPARIFQSVRNAVTAARIAQQSYLQRQALENFAGLVAHDLMTPLSGIIGYLDLALSQNADNLPEKTVEYLTASRDSGRYMEKLVRGLLEFARADKPRSNAELLNLNAVVDQSLRLLDQEIKDNNARIYVEELPTIHGHEIELIQLFQNLVSNAIHYRSNKEPEIHIFGTIQNDSVLIAVQDNGVGVPADKRDQIFAPLHREMTANKMGLGLGLATCSKIAKIHGGRIWVEPAEKNTTHTGTGSVFYISFPLENLHLAPSGTQVAASN